MLFFNFNNGLRVFDLLNLKISDIISDGEIVDSVVVTENKTNKNRELFFTADEKAVLHSYIKSLSGWQGDWYLFHATEADHRTPKWYQPMTTKNVYYKVASVGIGSRLIDPTAALSEAREARNHLENIVGKCNEYLANQERA